MTADNGSAVNADLTPDPQRPPWWDVDPRAVADDLSRQVAAQATEMAAMRTYISQLHHALGQLAPSLPPEVTTPTP